MTDNKHMRIKLNNGILIKIPKVEISKIILPSIRIDNNYFRLKIDVKNYEKEIERLKKRFKYPHQREISIYPKKKGVE